MLSYRSLGLLLAFLLTDLYFGSCLALVALRFFHGWRWPRRTWLICVGLARPAMALFLYYLLLITPHRSSNFYVATVIGCFTVLAVLSQMRKAPPPLALLIALMTSAGSLAHITQLDVPLIFHDAVVYAGIGTSAFTEREIRYRRYPLHEATGYYNVSEHGYGFPLIITWENLLAETCGWNKSAPSGSARFENTLFRSTSIFYGILLLILQAVLIAPYSKTAALLAPIATITAPRVAHAAFLFEIDTYRIFLTSLNLILLQSAVAEDDAPHQYALGIIGGLSGFVHGLGAASAALMGSVYFLCSRLESRERLWAGTRVALSALAAGGIHYLLDIAIGARPLWQ